jgi:glycerol-3-phosphate dehydrogenase
MRDFERVTTAKTSASPAKLRERQLKILQTERFDLVIIGGGIYGAMLQLYAAAAGLKSALIDRGDFGAETSFNSLRILHGGLRYIQSLDLRRSRESIREQRWFLRVFPELVRPLPCLLPLYKQGLRRPEFMRLAFSIDRILSIGRNMDLPVAQQLKPAQIVNPAETVKHFPQVANSGLAGGALWHDAAIPDTQRLIMETLNWARAQGGVAINYLEATDLLIEDAAIRGVDVCDRASGEQLRVEANVVINASGPRCEDLATRFDDGYVRSAYPSVAWNILFDREALSEYALGVAVREPGSQVYFLHPWKGRLLAGTGHGQILGGTMSEVERVHLDGMITDLNRAIPGLALSADQIQRVMSGILPVRKAGSTDLTKRPIVHDHGISGGPQGLISVAGVKLGASRIVADRAIRAAIKRYFGDRPRNTTHLGDRPSPRQGWQQSARDLGKLENDGLRSQLLPIIESEMVVHLDDLVLRRTTLWEDPPAVMELAPRLLALFDWDARQAENELARLTAALEQKVN